WTPFGSAFGSESSGSRCATAPRAWTSRASSIEVVRAPTSCEPPSPGWRGFDDLLRGGLGGVRGARPDRPGAPAGRTEAGGHQLSREAPPRGVGHGHELRRDRAGGVRLRRLGALGRLPPRGAAGRLVLA